MPGRRPSNQTGRERQHGHASPRHSCETSSLHALRPVTHVPMRPLPGRERDATAHKTWAGSTPATTMHQYDEAGNIQSSTPAPVLRRRWRGSSHHVRRRGEEHTFAGRALRSASRALPSLAPAGLSPAGARPENAAALPASAASAAALVPEDISERGGCLARASGLTSSYMRKKQMCARKFAATPSPSSI